MLAGISDVSVGAQWRSVEKCAGVTVPATAHPGITKRWTLATSSEPGEVSFHMCEAILHQTIHVEVFVIKHYDERYDEKVPAFSTITHRIFPYESSCF